MGFIHLIFHLPPPDAPAYRYYRPSARLYNLLESIRTTLDIYGQMIHGQDEEAVRKWQQNRALGQTIETVQ